VTVVLDSGAVSVLSRSRQRLRVIRDAGAWPPVTPAVVLTEALTGDHRRDFHANWLLRLCEIVPVDGLIAREAATLRTRAARRRITAVDAIVVATAARLADCVVLTRDPGELRALAERSGAELRIERV
jgi:predicted nucleic acid-binding protein